MMKKIKRTIIYIILTALLIGCLGGCATWDNFYKAFIDPPEIKETVKIAVLEPLTGADAREASAEVEGIELAHQLFPTVLGKDVELVYYDTKSDIEELKEATKKLCGEDISLVLGCYGNAMTIAAGDILKEHFIPAIAITCTNPLITKTNPLYSRVCCIDLYEAAGAAEFVYNGLGTTDAAILIQLNNDYSKAKGEEFASRLSELSGKTYIPVTGFDLQSTDLEAILRAFALIGSKVVYLPEDAETAAAVIDKARELALEFDWVGTSKWDGAGLEDVYFTADYSADEHQTSMTAAFNKAFAEKYGKDRIPSEEAALGFDAYLLALRGIEDAGTAKYGYMIAGRINKVEDLEGATGIITMNEIGDPVKGIVINKSSGGKQTTVDTVDPGRSAGENNDTESKKEQQ